MGVEDTRPIVRPIASAMASVDIQYARSCETDEPGYSNDAGLFPVVLRRFVLQVEHVNRLHLDGGADAAIEMFKTRVPAWKHVRDVLEHIDEYEHGRGNLQKRDLLRKPDDSDYHSVLVMGEITLEGVNPDGSTFGSTTAIARSITLQATDKGWKRSPMDGVEPSEWVFDFGKTIEAARELFQRVCDLAEELPGGHAEGSGEVD